MIKTDRVDLVRVVKSIGSLLVVVFVVIADTSVVVGAVFEWIVEETIDRIGDVVFRIDVVAVDEVSSSTVVSVIV